MSAKFVHTISDDPDLEKQLQKQIGCMTGILQLFERPSIITGKRLYGTKNLPAGLFLQNIFYFKTYGSHYSMG